jgi:hypothetical protein
MLLSTLELKEIVGWKEGRAVPPPSILFLLDNSYSMIRTEPRLDLAKYFFDLILKADEGGWVALATASGELHSIVPLTIDVPLTRLLLEDITPSPTGSRFEIVFHDLLNDLKKGPVPQQILFISDGEEYPPFQPGDEASLFAAIEGLPLLGTRLSTISVGKRENSTLLAKMAESGGGTFFELSKDDLLPSSEKIIRLMLNQKGRERISPALEPNYFRFTPTLLFLASLLVLAALWLNPR